MGIRKRIFVGFVCLALVLLFSGMISLGELGRLRDRVDKMTEVTERTRGFAEDLSTYLQRINSSVFRIAYLQGEKQDLMAELQENTDQFNRILREATDTIASLEELEGIYSANDTYSAIISSGIYSLDSSTVAEFTEEYLEAYNGLQNAISGYMTAPSNPTTTGAALLEKSVYRTITPSILTLVVTLLIVIMFFYFLDLYFVRPINSINKGLGSFIDYGARFRANTPEKGEIAELREKIEKITSDLKGRNS